MVFCNTLENQKEPPPRQSPYFKLKTVTDTTPATAVSKGTIPFHHDMESNGLNTCPGEHGGGSVDILRKAKYKGQSIISIFWIGFYLCHILLLTD